jgi:hypothetical protein
MIEPAAIAACRRRSRMKLMYEYPGVPPRIPYLVFHDGNESYYKVRIQGRFLYVSRGATVIDRGKGEVDIPHVGATRTPIGDFVYDTPAQAEAAFARFRAAPREALALVLAGHKP